MFLYDNNPRSKPLYREVVYLAGFLDFLKNKNKLEMELEVR